jgi:hypothetical protein
MNLIIGSTSKFVLHVYNDESESLADLTGATIMLVIKKRDTDTDAQALLSKAGVVTSLSAATAEVSITATESLLLKSYPEVVYELIVRLATGVYIRTGSNKLKTKPNVQKAIV